MLRWSMALALAGFLALWAQGSCVAGSAEYNPVARAPVGIGPAAARLIVGFRATPQNAVTLAVKSRRQGRPHTVIEAQTSAADVAALGARVGLPIAKSRQFTPSMHVLFLPQTLYGAALDAALGRLRADPAVRFAEVDERRHVSGVMPNDPLFAPSAGASGQWYMNTPSSTPIVLEGNTTEDLSATDAVSAWSITTGSPGIVIADVDTGVRFDHPDLLRAGLGGRLLPGYDFVGEDYDPSSGAALGTFLIANDGDGWDPDPSDPGDWISESDLSNALFASDTAQASSWHGTRVVGVFGAITNNAAGIAGMTWGAWVLPVRALGKGGGYDSDIIAGIEWAAGLPVTNPDGPPVPSNPYPADIINLSLGGSGSCPSDYQDALTQVTQLGVLVVASAGNGGNPGQAAPVDTPANCSLLVPGVVAVVGLRNVGTKVGYSSFGSGSSIAAPAGNCVQTTGDCLRSIDTTTNLGTTTPADDSYTDEANPNLGTSFSAPIVSGIAGLMRSVNYNLTPAQLAARLQASATPFPQSSADETSQPPTCPATDASSGECICPIDGSQCGAGMVNALAAVRAAQRPIGVIVIPATLANGSVLDASGSVAGCNGSASAPAPLSIVSFQWTASPAGIIVSGASTSKVTIDPAPGTLTLTLTDSAGNVDTESVTLTASTAQSTAPTSSGTSSSACPAAVVVHPAAPTVTESFAPASVVKNSAATLTVTLANSNGFALTQSSLSLSLPASLTIPTTPAAATTCSGAALSLVSTMSSVSLANANIPADGNCTITVPVESATAGSYGISIAAQALVTAPAGANAASASATLTVTAPGGGGGGGSLDWLDLLFVAGVLLAVRRPRFKPTGPPPRPRARR
ncbi:MAG TPA: S8 family serine peptidase [Steroidobacteraceae bacterium]|nr:S8 family serine peptidase [Steroidobacteraceae bacterium]